MLGCLGKALLRQEGGHIKIEKFEIRAAIKYFCKKAIHPKEVHEDFMKTLRNESPSYSTVKYRQQNLRRGERAFRMVDSLATLKMPPLMKCQGRPRYV